MVLVQDWVSKRVGRGRVGGKIGDGGGCDGGENRIGFVLLVGWFDELIDGSCWFGCGRVS